MLQDSTPIIVGPYEDPNLADAFIDDEPPFGANGDQHNAMLLQATRNLIKIKLTVSLCSHRLFNVISINKVFVAPMLLQIAVNSTAEHPSSTISARFIMDTEKFDEDANEVIENSLQSVPVVITAPIPE